MKFILMFVCSTIKQLFARFQKSQTMKSMEDKMNVLSDENFHLEHRLQIQNNKVTEYQSELDGVWKQTEEGEEGKSEVMGLKLANEQLNSELEKYQSSNEELKSEVEKLKEAQSVQFQEVEKLKSAEGELKEYQATVETLHSKVHELEMVINYYINFSLMATSDSLYKFYYKHSTIC